MYHSSYHKLLKHSKKNFVKFIEKIPSFGKVFICLDDKINKQVIKQIKNLVLTGGGAQLEGISQYAEMIFSSNVRIGFPKEDIFPDKSLINSSFSDVIGSSLFNPDVFLDKILDKQGKKQKKQGFTGFFNWLDQYI